jgi:hypothetical protein
MKATRVSPLKIWLALGVLGFCLAACSSPINQENFEKIQTGMTMTQVTAILGEPTESSSVDVAVFSGTVSKWKKGDVTITVQFVNGKVVAKQLSKSNQK